MNGPFDGEPLPARLLGAIADHCAWSAATFGPGPRLAGTLAHIREELKEIATDPHDVTEWVDVMLLAIQGAYRHGHAPDAIAAAFVAKVERNAARDWPDWRTLPADAPINHVRALGD